MTMDDGRIVDVALRGVGAITPTSRRLRSALSKVNYHRQRRWLDNEYLEGTLLLVPDQF